MKDNNRSFSPRLEEILAYPYNLFGMKPLTEEEVELYNRYAAFAQKGDNHPEHIFCRNNDINNILSNTINSYPQMSNREFKIMQLGMLFGDNEYWNSVSDLEDDKLAGVYGVRVDDVRMQRLYGVMASRLNEQKSLTR